jgi:hypothetical protein
LETIDPKKLAHVVRDAKAVAKRYKKLTGRPLGITGEVAEYEAARLLRLRLAVVRQDGYDALRDDVGQACRLQVKGRCIRGRKHGQVPKIKLTAEWDGVLLVLLDDDYEPIAIYEASRDAICDALQRPGSKARIERGSLAVSKFKSIGRKIWPPQQGANAT